MPSARISPARSAAFDVLLRVETRDSFAAELLHSNLLASLNSADRGLATELVMGVLRWRQKLDGILESIGKKPIAKFDVEVKAALRLGAYQLIYLNRIPARAAVNDSVELVKISGKRSAAPLVNAVLRKLSTQSADSLPSENDDLAQTYSHPSWLVERWIRTYGAAIAKSICEHNQKRPHTTIRFTTPAVVDEIAAAGIELEPAPLLARAWRVKQGDVTETRAYHDRRLAIQDEGSQLIALLAQGESILDCCAAPGGKSAIASQQNPSSLIVSMDMHVHRVRLMRELTRSATVLAADARRLPFARQFDCVMADLPCSGTGTLARNPEIKWRLTSDDLSRFSKLQLEILAAVAQQGENIIYSSCSLEPEEGEEVVSNFLLNNPEFEIYPIHLRLRELSQTGVIGTEVIESVTRGGFLRTIPGLHHCDGFFAAILRRA